MENTYYERTNGRIWELCQNRFRNNPNHPYNVCATAISHEQLKGMYDSLLSGGVDWLEMYDVYADFGYGFDKIGQVEFSELDDYLQSTLEVEPKGTDFLVGMVIE